MLETGTAKRMDWDMGSPRGAKRRSRCDGIHGRAQGWMRTNDRHMPCHEADITGCLKPKHGWELEKCLRYFQGAKVLKRLNNPPLLNPLSPIHTSRPVLEPIAKHPGQPTMLLSPISHLPSPGSPSELDGKPHFVYPGSSDALPLLSIIVSILLLSVVSTHLYAKNFALELLGWHDCENALVSKTDNGFIAK